MATLNPTPTKKRGRIPGTKNYDVHDDYALLETVFQLKMNWGSILQDLHNNQPGLQKKMGLTF